MAGWDEHWDDEEFRVGEDYRGPDDHDEREEAPLFGCACENPLSVDDCCPRCIAAMRSMEEEADGTKERVRKLGASLFKKGEG